MAAPNLWAGLGSVADSATSTRRQAITDYIDTLSKAKTDYDTREREKDSKKREEDRSFYDSMRTCDVDRYNALLPVVNAIARRRGWDLLPPIRPNAPGDSQTPGGGSAVDDGQAPGSTESQPATGLSPSALHKQPRIDETSPYWATDRPATGGEIGVLSPYWATSGQATGSGAGQMAFPLPPTPQLPDVRLSPSQAYSGSQSGGLQGIQAPAGGFEPVFPTGVPITPMPQTAAATPAAPATGDAAAAYATGALNSYLMRMLMLAGLNPALAPVQQAPVQSSPAGGAPGAGPMLSPSAAMGYAGNVNAWIPPSAGGGPLPGAAAGQQAPQAAGSLDPGGLSVAQAGYAGGAPAASGLSVSAALSGGTGAGAQTLNAPAVPDANDPRTSSRLASLPAPPDYTKLTGEVDRVKLYHGVQDMRQMGNRANALLALIRNSPRGGIAGKDLAAMERAAFEIIQIRQKQKPMLLAMPVQGPYAVMSADARARKLEMWEHETQEARSILAKVQQTRGQVTAGRSAASTLAVPTTQGTPRQVTPAGQARMAANAGSPGVVNTALSFLGTPYSKGGATSRGMDCSGFVQCSYGKLGVRLPHSAAEQFRVTTRISRNELQPGDLIFFSSTGGGRQVTHVGIYAGNGRFIQSSSKRGRVVLESLDQPYYLRRLAGYGRVRR